MLRFLQHFLVTVLVIILGALTVQAQETGEQEADTQATKDQQQCEAWISKFLMDESSEPWDPERVGVSRSGRCAELVNEAGLIEYLTTMRPRFFEEASDANAQYRACNSESYSQFRKCQAPNSTATCPPSDYCMGELKRYACIFKEAKAYEAAINELNEKRAARAVVDDLSEEKCIGDESRIWDAIDGYWEVLGQMERDTEAEQYGDY
jgi:hypothetical protein